MPLLATTTLDHFGSGVSSSNTAAASEAVSKTDTADADQGEKVTAISATASSDDDSFVHCPSPAPGNSGNSSTTAAFPTEHNDRRNQHDDDIAAAKLNSGGIFPEENSSQQTQPKSRQKYQIRHSGCAHVRGMIRRVWRPRYLELLENNSNPSGNGGGGLAVLLRYYELPPTKNTATMANNNNMMMTGYNGGNSNNVYSPWSTGSFHNDDNNNNNRTKTMIHKYTLQIDPTGTRILDVTTLRDMHTGLPRGTFGFVFRGKIIAPDDHDDSSATDPASARPNSDDCYYDDNDDDVDPRHHNNNNNPLDIFHNEDYYHHPSKNISKRVTATVVAGLGPCHDPNHHHTHNNHNAAGSGNSRDFLCAVSSLEEAQMWVVALQWASQQQQQQQAAATTAITKTRSKHSNKKEMSSSDTAMMQRQPRQRRRQHPGKVVVTKVPTYRFVRLAPVGYWRWEIAYEIHANLLITTSKDSSDGNNNGKCISKQWVIWRTVNDFECLIRQLTAELESKNTSSNDDGNEPKRQTNNDKLRYEEEQQLQKQSKKWLQILEQLPRLSSSRSSFSFFDLPSTCIPVDALLRSLVVDAATVNTRALRTFLGVQQATNTKGGNGNDSSTTTTSSTVVQIISWRQHDSQAIQKRHTVSLPKDVSTDDYVKQWLSSTSTTASTPTTCYYYFYCYLVMQQPLLVGLSTAALVAPLCRLWMFHMPTLSMRLDYLIASWIGAAYVGRQQQQQQRYANYNGDNGSGKSFRNSPWQYLVDKYYSYFSKSSTREKNLSQKTKDKKMRHRETANDDDTAKNADHRTANVSTSTKGGSSIIIDHTSQHEEVADADGNILSSSVAGIMNDEDDGDESDGDAAVGGHSQVEVDCGVLDKKLRLSSPLPEYDPQATAAADPANGGFISSDSSGVLLSQSSCWNRPPSHIFHVRGTNYFEDRIKVPSIAAPLTCRGVDCWMTDNPVRHIARHPAVLGGKLGEKDTFLVNFLLPFANFVSYFEIPPLDEFPPQLADVWTKFLKGDQEYRDARLKLLPVVVEGPWIVKVAVGNGKTPALLGKVIPLQYFFRPSNGGHDNGNKGDGGRRGVFEVDVIITASTIARGILNVVKGHSNALSIAFAIIIEAAVETELPETVLCTFQINSLQLEDCPQLPDFEDAEEDKEIAP